PSRSQRRQERLSQGGLRGGSRQRVRQARGASRDGKRPAASGLRGPPDSRRREPSTLVGGGARSQRTYQVLDISGPRKAQPSLTQILPANGERGRLQACPNRGAWRGWK